jgi:hypothetical protein
MMKLLRRWHWNLLHKTFGLPDHDHAEPTAPLSVILHSHPPVPAHHHRGGHGHSSSLQSQLEREMQRQPRILKGWQNGIHAFIGHRTTKESARGDDR